MTLTSFVLDTMRFRVRWQIRLYLLLGFLRLPLKTKLFLCFYGFCTALKAVLRPKFLLLVLLVAVVLAVVVAAFSLGRQWYSSAQPVEISSPK